MNYRKKYQKYKQKYLNLSEKQRGGAGEPKITVSHQAQLSDTASSNSQSNVSNIGKENYLKDIRPTLPYPPQFSWIKPEHIIGKLKAKASENAYNLIKVLKSHKVATAESLTGGLIHSTLVDVPFGGWNKYGCFGVYDTNAKRAFLGVTVKDVYTHKCAKEMAVGVLKNSEATLAIAVTGNAMPNQLDPKDVPKLGEVFIGIAGYRDKNTIVVQTKVYNFCKNPIIKDDDGSICKYWVDSIDTENKLFEKSDDKEKAKYQRYTDKFNDFSNTNLVSKYVRYSTVCQALSDAQEFLNKNELYSKYSDKNYEQERDKLWMNYVNRYTDIQAQKGEQIMNRFIYTTCKVECLNKECDDDIRSDKSTLYDL